MRGVTKYQAKKVVFYFAAECLRSKYDGYNN